MIYLILHPTIGPPACDTSVQASASNFSRYTIQHLGMSSASVLQGESMVFLSIEFGKNTAIEVHHSETRIQEMRD